MQEKLKMISCPKCGNDFPELRKILYSYHVCVNCSTTKALVGITTVEGAGDHTYNDQDRALGIQRHADELNGKKTPTIVEILDFDRESAEAEVTQSIKDKTKTLQEEGEEDDYDLFDPEKEQEGIEGIDY
jgi:hypothetical protein